MPSEFHNREPPLPFGNPKSRPWYGMDIFWNRPIRKKLLDCSLYSEPFFFKLCFKWLDKGPKVKEFLVCYRHPNTACEVLTADVYAIIDKLTNNEVLVLS